MEHFQIYQRQPLHGMMLDSCLAILEREGEKGRAEGRGRGVEAKGRVEVAKGRVEAAKGRVEAVKGRVEVSKEEIVQDGAGALVGGVPVAGGEKQGSEQGSEQGGQEHGVRSSGSLSTVEYATSVSSHAAYSTVEYATWEEVEFFEMGGKVKPAEEIELELAAGADEGKSEMVELELAVDATIGDRKRAKKKRKWWKKMMRRKTKKED